MYSKILQVHEVEIFVFFTNDLPGERILKIGPSLQKKSMLSQNVRFSLGHRVLLQTRKSAMPGTAGKPAPGIYACWSLLKVNQTIFTQISRIFIDVSNETQ